MDFSILDKEKIKWTENIGKICTITLISRHNAKLCLSQASYDKLDLIATSARIQIFNFLI